MLRTIWALAVLVLAEPAASAGQAVTQSHADTLTVQPGNRLACLSRTWVIPSSLQLSVGPTVLESEVDYSLAADTGCLTLMLSTEQLSSGLLVAQYRTLPLNLKPVYQLHRDPRDGRAASGPELPAEAVSESKDFAPAPAEGLAVSGSQTFGITVGNRRDLKLQQSLDVRLSGRVGENAELLAILSDQDIPFQPSGSTAELDELDKVLVEFRTPKASAGLGDVELNNQGTLFLNFDRRVTGFQGEAQLGSAWNKGTVASAKGEYLSTEFYGVDGRQGPYRLRDRAGTDFVVVVAGSEKVWLDGVRMQRGRENDYVIDYAVGELTFTSRRGITVNSRITVEYEASQGRYKRRLLFAGSENIDLGRGGRLRAGYFSERDDSGAVLGGELSDAERAQLETLGDNVGTVSGGTRYVGSDPSLGGEYRLVVDPISGRNVFVFVDVGGDYQVEFLEVGPQRGEYTVDLQASSQSRTVYQFVGEGEGEYLVRRDLPAPRTRDVLGLRWETAGRAGRVVAEGAFSNHDANTLSSLGDHDNQGGGMWVEAKGTAWAISDAVSIEPELRVRRVEEDFTTPSRFRQSFYSWHWNLAEEPTGGELLTEGRLGAKLGSPLAWNSEFGRLAVGDTMTAWRHRQTLDWADAWMEGHGVWSNVVNHGDAQRLGDLGHRSAELRLVRFGVKPRGEWLSEHRWTPGSAASQRSNAWNGGLEFPLPRTPFRVDVGVGRRRDDARPDPSAPWFEQRQEQTGHVGLNGRVKTLAVDARYERRTIQAGGAGADRFDLGRLDLRHDAMRGAWNAVTTWDLGTVALDQRRKVIVADSTGYFDAFGNYVGSGGGYDVRYEDGDGLGTATARLDMATRLRWSPRGGDTGPAWLQQVAWEGFVNLNEAAPLSGTSPLALLAPGRFLDPDLVADGQLRAQQTMDLFPQARRLGFQLRHELSRNLLRYGAETSGEGLLESTHDNTFAALVRTQPARQWNLELEGSWGNREANVESSASGTFAQKTAVRSALLRGGRRLGLRNGGRVSTEVVFTRETGPGREAQGWSLRPRLTYAVARSGRVDLRTSWTTLTRNSGFVALRGIGAPTMTPGWRVDLRGEVRVLAGINVSATVRYDAPQGLAPITESRMEVRGAF